MDVGPKYRKVYRALKEKIESGEYGPGRKIPSTNALCLEHNCSSTSINMAILLLTGDGYLIGTPGVGRFVADE